MVQRKTRKVPGPKLTDMQARFLTLIPVSKSLREAYVNAGYSPTGADANATRLLNKPGMRELARRILADNGIDEDLIAKKIREGMEARNRTTDIKGNVVDLGPDHMIRFKFTELAAKITTILPDPRLELTGDGGGAIVVRVTPGLDEG